MNGQFIAYNNPCPKAAPINCIGINAKASYPVPAVVCGLNASIIDTAGLICPGPPNAVEANAPKKIPIAHPRTTITHLPG